MTQNQLDWMQKQGLDPAQYDMAPDGRVLRRQTVPVEPQREVMSPLRAGLTSFAGSVLPSAAGLGGAKLGMVAGAPLGPVGIGLGALAGGLGAGYLAGKGQEAALEKLAPEALQQLSQAQTDQPIASYVGGFAPNALTFRPSLQGMSGLLRPTVRGEETLRAALSNPNFIAPAANVAANVGASTAGQLINVAEGGEFSAPRFAADVALGTLFNKPTALGRRMGFQDTPQPMRTEAPDLAKAQDYAKLMADVPEEFSTTWRERRGVNSDLEAPDQFFTAEGKRMSESGFEKDYSNWWKSETEPTADLLKGVADEVKAKVPPEKLKELSSDPEVAQVLQDPSKMEAFIAKQADQTLEDVYQMMERREAKKQFATAEEAANQKAFQELREERGFTQKTVTPEASDLLGKVDKGGVPGFMTNNLRRIAQENGIVVTDADTPNTVIQKLRDLAAPSNVNESYKQSKVNATEAAKEVYTRLQRAPEEGPVRKISQEDINLANEVANRRGLKIQLDRAFAGDQEVRGIYFEDPKTGERIIRVNPLMATADTAIHEIGHDIFKGVTNKGMRRSLMDTAMDSPAYKAELAARAEEVKQGKLTQEQANDIALEEGLIQAFGEQMPQVKRGELRAWYQAFKASMKQLVTGKMSPEDALAWMHYATTEAVPWKGVAVAKGGDVGGEERMQRAQQGTPEFKAWFGDSKVVDAEGKPLVMYHGTRSPQDFNTFRTDSGHNYGPGAYFTPEARRASGYAGEQEGARVYSTYVSVENPYTVQSDATIQDLGYKLRQDPANDALIQKLLQKYNSTDKNILGNAEVGNAWLREQGYDGIIKQRNRYTEDGYVPEVVEVVAFNPEQVKSATANKGTFDPLNKDIRYQRSLGSKIKTPSELDYLVTKGGPFAEVGTTIKAAANTRDFKQGQWSSKYSLTNALPEEARVRLLNHLAGEFDSGVRKAPASDIKAAYDQLRNEYLPAIVKDYNTAGFTVRDTAGLRARGSNPTYFPLHSIGETIKDVLTTQQGSAAWDKLKSDFINWNTQLRQADGATLSEAQRYAQEKFEEKLSITAKPPGIESGIPFSGARKPEGYPLPPSWRSNDIIDILNNYTRRSATDFAYQKHVESSPTAMAALGAKTMVNNQPIPANILQSTAPVINDPSVQSVLREYRGTPAQKTEGTLQSLGRFVSAATIGPVSKVGDIGTSMFKGLAYLPGSEYAAGLSEFTNKIADWAALKERSYASGLNKRDAAENMRQVLGIAEDSTAFMDKAARVLSKGTFVNDLESAARVIAQGWGETIVGINKKLALGGDKNALQMLDTLSPDWRTRPDADLAAQVGRLLQGSYDMRQLPASVLEGAAAPYLTWSKWSMGQYDSFVKYALQPAMQGNMKPLIGQMLIGLLGGGAISAVQGWLNNREGKDITWKELESWMQQNQGELGADGGLMLGQKLLTMAQKMGTFGFAGDLAKMTLDAAAGGSTQGVATMPAMDAVYDVSKRTAAAIKALDDGEDFGLVMKALMQDSLTGHVQALRVARNWLDEDENLRYDDRRRRRLYDELTGLPSKGGTFAVNYSNLSEREFERGELGGKTGEEAMSLVMRARQEATSPEDYASRIRKLKTSQNQIMPSLERQPMKAARYLNWLEGTEEGKGGETMRRYMIRQSEDKYRKSLIEGLSGLR
jgi:transcriptional regulator with XRE-family HTH domain